MENMYRNQIKTRFPKRSLLTLILGGTLFYGIAVSAPSAPTPSELCASNPNGENCVSHAPPNLEKINPPKALPSAGGAIPKSVNPRNFHPGHYMRVGTDSRKNFNAIANNPDFIGVKKTYNWVDIETSLGQYNFDEIELDLKHAASLKKYFWIEIRMFQNNEKGNPRTPKYMWRNQSYGCDPKNYGNYQRHINYGGWLPCFPNKNVKARVKALYSALGRRFNKSTGYYAYFEGINILETSAGKVGWGYTVADIERAWKDNILALKNAFPNKVVMQHINFAPFDLTKFATFLVNNGIAIGGPDMKLNTNQSRSLHTTIYPLYKGSNGKVPVGPDVQWKNYEESKPGGGVYSVGELLQGAIRKTDPHYIFWLKREPYFSEVVKAVRNTPLPAAERFNATQK